MKIFKIIAVLFFAVSCKAQVVVNINTYNQGNNSNKYFKDIDNNYQKFVGTWEVTEGTKTFRLIIWKESNVEMKSETNTKIDFLMAKYLIIENLGTPFQRTLKNSIRYFKKNNYTSNSIMIAWATNGNGFAGAFTDTHANGGNGVLDGAFKFDIINNINPIQAHWKLKSTGAPEDGQSFSIPTEAILTKVN